MSKSRSLIIRAGPTAARRLREEGFHPDLFTTLVGASGGPKWLVLRGLDAFWADRLITGRSRPIDAIGSSIGSFRHACLGQRDPRAALERFAEGYVEQTYADRRPDPATIPRESRRIVDEMLGEKGAEGVAHNEIFRGHILATRLRAGRVGERGLALRLAAAACANAFSRRTLGRFFERGVFGPARSAIRFSGFPTLTRTLDAASLDDVVMIAPSDDFIAALPGAHVPDRTDFVDLATGDRIRQWRAVMARCAALSDELCDLVDGGGLADALRPFPGAA